MTKEEVFNMVLEEIIKNSKSKSKLKNVITDKKYIKITITILIPKK